VPLKARCATQLQGDVALLATYVYSARCRSLPSICSSVLVLQVHNCQPPPHLFYPKYPLYVLKANEAGLVVLLCLYTAVHATCYLQAGCH